MRTVDDIGFHALATPLLRKFVYQKIFLVSLIDSGLLVPEQLPLFSQISHKILAGTKIYAFLVSIYFLKKIWYINHNGLTTVVFGTMFSCADLQNYSGTNKT